MSLDLAEKFSPFVIGDYLTFDSLYYVLLSYLLLYLAKKINDFFQSSFSLDEQLLVKDNKALAVSFTGYFLGMGIIIYAVLVSPLSYYLEQSFGDRFWVSSLDTVIWGVIGIIFLNLSRLINDKALLPYFRNLDEIIKDRNVGTGAVQLGSYLASALVIAGIISHGNEYSFLIDLLYSLFYFVLGQLLLIVFAKIYASIVSYPLHEEIEKDNEAAGISFGLNLVAIGIFLFFSLKTTDNILVFLAWFVNGVVFLTLSRWLFNKIILHRSDLDHEIQVDRNWGIAFLEGSIAVLVACVVNASFL